MKMTILQKSGGLVMNGREDEERNRKVGGNSILFCSQDMMEAHS